MGTPYGVYHQTSNSAYQTLGIITVKRQKGGEYLYYKLLNY